MQFSIPFIFLACLFAYRAPALSGSGITDPDYYWHLGYGEWMVNNLRLPTEDFWSWTYGGHSYRLTQWLGEVCMGLAHQLAGETGTAALAALLVSLTMAASYRAARCFLPNRLAALVIAVGCNAILVSLPCRPHQFTHLGLAVLSWIVASFQSGNRRALYCIPPLFGVWVNLHGGYAFGLTYLGIVAGLTAIEAYVAHDAAAVRAKAIPLFVVTGLALLATLLNPYGWGAWQYAIEIANMKASAGIVDEWAATNIKTDVGINFYIVTSAMAAAMTMTHRRPTLSQVLAALALSALGWSAVRLSLMVTVLMVPIVAAAVRDTPFYALVFDGPKSRLYDREFGIGKSAAVVILTLALSAGFSKLDQRTTRYMAANLPVTEVEFMQKNNIEGRILNTPEAGGYLIRHLGTKVSIDTRYDLYGDRALFEHLFAMRGDAGWEEYLACLNPDIVLLNNPAALRHALANSQHYRPVFEGQAYTVLIRHDQRPDLPTIELSRPNKAVLNQLKS